MRVVVVEGCFRVVVTVFSGRTVTAREDVVVTGFRTFVFDTGVNVFPDLVGGVRLMRVVVFVAEGRFGAVVVLGVTVVDF